MNHNNKNLIHMAASVSLYTFGRHECQFVYRLFWNTKRGLTEALCSPSLMLN